MAKRYGGMRAPSVRNVGTISTGPFKYSHSSQPTLYIPGRANFLFILTDALTLTPRAPMLRTYSVHVGPAGGSHRFSFGFGDSGVVTYRWPPGGSAEAARALKTSNSSLWRLGKAFDEL